VQRPLAARFDGEVAGGAVEIFVLVNLVGATMELGRSGRSMMMMTSASASGSAGSLSEVQRPTGFIDSDRQILQHLR
jgi:hypothetical protein